MSALRCNHTCVEWLLDVDEPSEFRCSLCLEWLEECRSCDGSGDIEEDDRGHVVSWTCEMCGGAGFRKALDTNTNANESKGGSRG